MRKRVKILLAFCAGIICYIVLHEFGHMIVILASGASVTEFSIVRAHVSYSEGLFTVNQNLWINVNGALFPLLISYIYAIAYRRNLKNIFYRVFSVVVCGGAACSLLAWVVIPILYYWGKAPTGDDVTKFIFYFSLDHNPIFISMIAGALHVFSVYLIVKNGIMKVDFTSTSAPLKSAHPML